MKNLRKKLRKLYIISCASILIYIIVDLGKAALMGMIYDSFNDINILMQLSFLVFFIIICIFVSGYFKNMLYQKVRYVFRYTLSQELLTAYFKKNPEVYHNQQDSSKVINTITNKVDEVTENICINKLTSFYYIASVSLSSFYIAFINVYSLIFIYVFVFVLLSVNYIYKTKLKENQKKVLIEKEKWIRTNKELFQNYDLIKNYQMETNMLELANKNNKTMNDYIYKSEMFKGTLIVLNDSISNILFLGFLLFSGVLVNKGIISAGQMIMMIQASNLITLPLTSYANLRNNRFSVEPFMEDLENIINCKDVATSNTSDVKDIQQICFHNVSFCYHQKVILQDIELKLKINRHYLICGESGSGKSTLLKLIIKNLNNYEGSIMINNTELRNISFEKWMTHVSYVDQKSTMLPLSLKDNIILNSEYDANKLSYILKTVNLDCFAKNLDEYVSQEHMELSGGELQRLNLARALYQNHEILILDEAFSALDKNNEYNILKNVMKEKNSVLCISHRIDKTILHLFDEIIFVKDHCIIQGLYDELIQREDFVSFMHHNKNELK